MKDYKVENPQFTDTLQITETTDTSHADNINRAPKQAFENTLYLEKSKVAADGGDVSDTVIKTEGDAGEEDYPVPEAGDTSKTFLGKTKKFISNFKDWMTGVCMLGAIVNNCVTDNPNLPLSAAQGKALQDALTVLNNELKETSSNLNGFNFYYFKAWSHAHIVSDILDDTAFCILGENYYSTVTKVEGQMYISNVVGNGDITFNNNVVTINIADKFGIIISNKEITIK